jgi:hypothetical protein|uniref:Uncharacterized protein n=1 Tax=viral metagenome TaxID=1070528 RepID=A0A6C0AGW3_9ZZZZ
MNRINPFSDMKYTNVDDSHFAGFYSNTVPRFGLVPIGKGGTRRKRRKSVRHKKLKCK